MADAVDARPSGLLTHFNELLHGGAVDGEGIGDRGRPSLGLIAGCLSGYAAYGAAAGLFQGGAQTLVAAMKVPLIILWSVLLCAPSLYVFASLAGARLSARRFARILAGFGGMLALLLVGLLPVNWLFSVSSRSTAFLLWFHLAVWLIALRFGLRYLGQVLPEPGIRSGLSLWIILFCVVSFQVTTYLRPLLWRGESQPVFQSERMFFMEHLGQVLD